MIHHFKVYSSVIFSVCTRFCSYHHYLIMILSPQKEIPHALAFPPSPPPPILRSNWQPLIYFLSLWICLFWTFHINGIKHYVIFRDWLLSFFIMFSKFIHVVALLHYFLLTNNILLCGYTIF